MTIVDESEAFYFKDFELDDSIYRIFNYRLASYTEFLRPSAMECRGHMFEVTSAGYDAQPIRLASLPVEKFFNLNENPMTMDLDLSTAVEVGVKADGSLISTYLHYNKNEPGSVELRLKSKGSLSSDQAIAAMEWLKLPQNEDFYKELKGAATLGYTVNLEWVSPENRIVLSYDEPSLIVLNVRYHDDGSYVHYNDVDADVFPNILDRWISFEDVEDAPSFAQNIPDMQGVEGFVIRLASGQRVKVKTLWYLALHHTKDNINSPRRLFEAVLEEATDDMRTLFVDDPIALQTIADMEVFVEKHYNHMVDTVERFYERNKHQDRKTYAILGQEELNRTFFGLAMSKYLGKDVSYKDTMKKNWKGYGLKDIEKDEDDE